MREQAALAIAGGSKRPQDAVALATRSMPITLRNARRAFDSSHRLNADWILLSACNTAAGEGAGADAVSGLGRAFFYAGARALLVSNWPVETTSARALTTGLFRQSPGLSRAEALQATMRWMIDQAEFVDSESGKIVFSYAHPIFWAPFTLVGDGGGPTTAVRTP